MDIISRITQFLIATRDDIGVKNIFLFESSNGFVMSSTIRKDAAFDLEALGSLSSGSISAMELLFELFASSKVESQILETPEEKFLFYRVFENYFLFLSAPHSTKMGFLIMKIKRILPDLVEQIKEFNKINKVEVSDINIEDISEKLDAQFDSLISED